MYWMEALKLASKTKKFTRRDKVLASLWITCPIYEVAHRIELKDDNLELGPTDLYLLLDGIYFTKGVENDDVELATNCFKSIHKQVEALEKGTDKVSTMKRMYGNI